MDALIGGLSSGPSPFGLDPALDPERLAGLTQPKAEREKAANDVASRFEGVFWSLLTKEMRDSLEPGTFLGEDTGDVLGGMFDLYMGEHLAQGQTLGIAALIKRQLQGRMSHEQHTTEPADGKRREGVAPVGRDSAGASLSGTR